MRYKHFIWDYDGTLFNSYPVMAAAFCEALAERGMTEPPETVMSYMKISMGHAIRHYTAKCGLDDAFMVRFKTLNQQAESENTRPFDGVLALCHDICANGGKNYLFTHRGESALFFLNKFRVADCFTELITSKQSFTRKPSPEALLYLIEKYAIVPDEAIMIGDRELDIQAAVNAGIHSCYFSDGNNVCPLADFTITDYSVFYTLIRPFKISS